MEAAPAVSLRSLLPAVAQITRPVAGAMPGDASGAVPDPEPGRLKPLGSGEAGGGGSSPSALPRGIGASSCGSGSGAAALQQIRRLPLAAASTLVQTVIGIFTEGLRSGALPGSPAAHPHELP